MRGTSISRLLPYAIVIAGLAGIGVSAASAAAQSSIPDRITMAVSSGSMTEIPGSVQPRALQATDLGPVPGDTRLTGMSLRFLPSAAQQAALDQLLADLQDPSSPRFHQWLTPQQYAAQFGLSSGDLAKITAWLASQGFTVTGVAQGGSFVTFDGTVAQAQTAFSTSIHNLSVNGETHFANLTNLSVPSAFAGVVGAITGLHDFRLKPRLHASVAQPQFTSSYTGNHFLAPGDLYTIYDTQPLLNSGINGSGISIAVMGIVDISTADVAAFRSASGLSTTNLPTTVHAGADPGGAHNCVPGGTGSCASPNLDDLAEASLDVEWSGAMAPSASILFVNGVNIFDYSMTYAVDENVAPIITISYGACEAAQGSSVLNWYNQLFKQASAQGQTILAASADTGATDCDSNLMETTATEGLAVDFPASSPYVTGLGGTMFTGDAAATCISGVCNGSTPSDYSTTTYWAGTPSSTDVVSSALKYIPEAAWNDTSYGGFGGGGGGASSFFAKPAWQVETGATGMATTVSPDGARDVPDLALDASDEHDTYLFCYDGYCTNGFRNAQGSTDGGSLYGGTSFDAQIFGGMLALIEQKNSLTKAGNINPLLYALGNNATYYNTTTSSVFHDITAGGNAMPCQSGTTECPSGGTLGYSTGTGYDLATGWGTVDLNNLAGAWSWAEAHPEGLGSLGANLSSTALASSTSTSSPTTVAVGAAFTLTATVTGYNMNLVPVPNFSINPTASSTTPTGTVQFLINNVVVGSGALNSSGVATYAWSPACSAVGVTQSATAVYTGDATYQGSIGPALTVGSESPNSSDDYATNPLILTVTAGSVCPSFSVAGPAGSVSVASGGTIPPVTITATSVNGFTGTVTFSYSVSVSSSAEVLPTIGLSPLSVTLAANGTATTTLTLSGITAGLRLPNAPGAVDSGTMLAQQGPRRTSPWPLAGPGAALACLLLLVLPRRRRRLGGLLLVALSVALALGATGCGGSSQSGPPAPNTNPYAGVYYVTITGTFNGTPILTPQSTTVTYYIN